MSKIAIFNVAQSGHINPTLDLTRELVAHGEKVVYYTNSAYESALKTTGATFRPTDTTGFITRLSGNRGPADLIDFAGVFKQVAPDVLSECPDYVMYDSMCVWGRLMAKYLKVPAIRLCASHAFAKSTFTPIDIALEMTPIFNVFIPFMQRSVNHITTQYQLDPIAIREVFLQPEILNLVFLPKQFQLAGETFGDDFKFVGPSVDREESHVDDFPFSALENSGRKVLYISLGTIANKRLDFYRRCIVAFKDSSEWQIVMSVGKQIDISKLGSIPANFIVRRTVPQLKLMQSVSIFMTHGGMNSTMEALYYGIPLILLPQMGEQEVNAKRVVELGAGIQLQNSTNSSVQELFQAVETIAGDSSYSDHAADMKQVIRNTGGYRQAVAEIQEFKIRYLSQGSQ